MSEELRALEIILTARCNLRCSYCYQNAKKARSVEWETLRASLDLLFRSGRKKVNVLFIGGEPLLEFPLVQRAVAYVEDVRRRDLSVHYAIFTNGILLADEHIKFFDAHGVDVQLSFDGVPVLQALRGEGTFAVLDRRLDRLREEHRDFLRRKLRISLTLLPQTIPWFPDSVSYFLGKGVQTVVISPDVTSQGNGRCAESTSSTAHSSGSSRCALTTITRPVKCRSPPFEGTTDVPSTRRPTCRCVLWPTVTKLRSIRTVRYSVAPPSRNRSRCFRLGSCATGSNC